jgi:hypothetical protein
LFLLASCTGLGARIDLGYMQVQPSGHLALETGGGGGPPAVSRNNDINSDLGIATELDSPYARVELDFGLLHLTGSGFSVKDQATGVLTADFGTIPVNTPVETDLDLQVYKAAATLDLIDIGPVRISPGLAADVILSNTTITATSLTVQEDLDGTIPLPMLFIQGEADLGIVDFVLDLGWLDASYGDVSGEILDLEFLARLQPIGPLTIFVGYRVVQLDITGDQDGDSGRIDLEFEGWMGGLGLHF